MLVPAACAPAPRSFLFGPFTLQPERQLLLRDDKPIRIGGRALDLLTALVERPGEVLSKKDLVSRAWPNLYIEECNLKVNIAALRRLLGETHAARQYIATVTGRGYRFIAPVQTPGAARDRSNETEQLVFTAGGHGARLMSLYARYSFHLEPRSGSRSWSDADPNARYSPDAPPP
ncbi:winged helix-turn-helix domain-containing protein [Caulobacter soli]|uniref:winged helix-turn-helix domain-containing protein n=1 Tax=Caulobacter soli TaxID=2708539 RepID=UPI0013EB309A|nr:transcriptional regulator [Caulobacter soli]